ncbi:glycosyl transferase family 1 [Micromonospora lupini]|uniref:glycosyltransferase family protein n=1 Tax=Micromonospora lupini TaxID=285679 RepID=UPI00224F1213|nr:glycosyltransferase [Micromonospora lupini]MCX5070031.1 glycosyl transferase family 1 [Micromonospora lupini]
MREVDVPMLADEEFPRVLVVSHTPFSRVSGTAMTLSNLFSGWPRDRLGQVYTGNITPSTEVCENYFHFPPRDHYLPIQYYSMRMLGWNGHTPLQQSRPIAAVHAAAESRPTVARVYAQLRASADLSPIRVPPALIRWMRDFRPDVVYSMLGSVRLTRITALAARTCGVPVVPHFTDDWPATLHANGELFGRATRSVQETTARLVRLAPLGMVISQPMADEYARRYGIPFSPFVNCVDESFFAAPRSDSDRQRGVELVYVGALHLNRWESLRDIGAALDDVAQTGPAVRLTIHAPERDLAQYGRHFADLRRVRLGPSLTSEEVPAALRSADVLVHIESFDEEIRRYTRYSVSTKIPQYLASGRPILGYGPAEVASMDHIRQAGAGVIVGTNDRASLVHDIAALCGDAALRERLARNGVEFARQEHAGESVAARFAATLRAAARAGSVTPDTAGVHLAPRRGGVRR